MLEEDPFLSSLTERLCSMQRAAQRHMDFTLGIYADPIYLGHYPDSVVDRVQHLPQFTEKQQKLLKGSTDYFAL